MGYFYQRAVASVLFIVKLLVVTGCYLFKPRSRQVLFIYLLSIFYCLFFIVYFLLFIFCCLFFIFYFLFPISYFLFIPYSLLPSTLFSIVIYVSIWRKKYFNF